MNVLIVDDQSSARTMLRHVVEGIDPAMRVADFGNPDEALRWSAAQAPDLVLLDYRMPEMDGLEFARRFRDLPARRDVPIVLISVVGDEPTHQAALDAGIMDFLVKPVRPRELRSRCRNLLDLRQHGESAKERVAELERRLDETQAELERCEQEAVHCLLRAAALREPALLPRQRHLALLAHRLAEASDLGEDEARRIARAAPLVDIGRLALGDAERAAVDAADEPERSQRLMLAAVRVLGEASSPALRTALQIVRCIAEHWDGSGPRGLAGTDIPLAARIVALAVAIDDLAPARDDGGVDTLDAALGHVASQRGARFDPGLVDAALANRERLARTGA